jgi:hypothetical protein
MGGRVAGWKRFLAGFVNPVRRRIAQANVLGRCARDVLRPTAKEPLADQPGKQPGPERKNQTLQ